MSKALRNGNVSVLRPAMRNRMTARIRPSSTVVIARGLLFLLVVVLYNSIAPNIRYLPSAENVLELSAIFMLIGLIKNRYARVVFLAWAWWAVIGSISLFAQNQRQIGLNYNLDPSIANRYYLICVVGAIFGGYITQLVTNRTLTKARVHDRSQSIQWAALFVFPTLYVASIIISTRAIPLLSGEDVSALMYERDYGPLHGFGIFVVVSCVMLCMHMQRSIKPIRWLSNRMAVLLLVAFLVAASFDGRRVLSVLGIMAILLYYAGQRGSFLRWTRAAILASSVLIGYLVVGALRRGGEARDVFTSLWDALAAVGTEYRDFIYGFEVIPRNSVLAAGYNWLESTAVTLVPSFLLNAAGFDKRSILSHDSARTLMRFWDVKLGIRIGLPGELWFAYGWGGLLFFPAFGAVIVCLAALAVRTRHGVYRAILLTGLAIAALAVVGQSTVTFGLILPLVYLALAATVVDRRMNRVVGKARKSLAF